MAPGSSLPIELIEEAQRAAVVAHTQVEQLARLSLTFASHLEDEALGVAWANNPECLKLVQAVLQEQPQQGDKTSQVRSLVSQFFTDRSHTVQATWTKLLVGMASPLPKWPRSRPAARHATANRNLVYFKHHYIYNLSLF